MSLAEVWITVIWVMAIVGMICYLIGGRRDD